MTAPSGSSPVSRLTSTIADEWLWGWDPTPGIVSVWADGSGRATIWRRLPDEGRLVRERERFRPWVLLDTLVDLRHLGARLTTEGNPDGTVWYRELPGAGALRFLLSAVDARTLKSAILTGASTRLGQRVSNLRDLGQDAVLTLPPEEQYLVSSGRTYFGGLALDDLRLLQFDLETQGLNTSQHRIFMVSIRDPSGRVDVLEVNGDSDAEEADLIRRLCRVIREADPDVIENHNLHGFDLPFLNRRAQILRVPLDLGRIGAPASSTPCSFARTCVRALRCRRITRVARRPTPAPPCTCLRRVWPGVW